MLVGYSAIGEGIRQARIQKGLSQLELAERLGLTQGTVSRAELGRDLRLATLMEIARALNLEVMLVPRAMVSPIRAILGEAGSHARTNTVYAGVDSGPYDEGDTAEALREEPLRRRRSRARTKNGVA